MAFIDELTAAFQASPAAAALGDAFKKHAASGAFWEIAKALGAFYNQPGNVAAAPACRALIDRIREYQGEKAQTSDQPTTVVFGTSGWRGVIGEDFTLLNVHKVVRGIIEMMREPVFLKANGYQTFAEVQSHGIVILRDNRYLGEVFMAAAEKELAAAGIRVMSAGMCPTGVGSAIVTECGAAGSLNFTPSHNPMDYAGLKFNPADGGPAGPELTSVIEEKANLYMRPGANFVPVAAAPAKPAQKLDAPAMFAEFVAKKSKVFDLGAIREWLRAHVQDLALVVDFMHGASRGYVERLLGADLVAALEQGGALTRLHTEDDYSFHGVKPEPSAANQAPLIALLKDKRRPLSLAVALDPDADRIRFADADADIDMNRFGAIAYAGLLARGLRGGIASTAPSSDFALEIAKREKQPVYEFAVGFKNFREPLAKNQVLIAFEESDGITCMGHTLEKCSLCGLLLALDAMMRSGKNLSAQYQALREKYGWFYPSKAGAEVTGVSVEEWEAYKKQVIDALQHRLYKIGDSVEIGGTRKKIAAINVIDGLKVIFADKSWILLRPSGTEPKFRYYFELAAERPIADSEKELAAYRDAAAGILAAARELIK
ncbi:MAG: phosphomannomutase [Planctomycetes bacterium]|nr:phosphomannomutase [Planctomycetota bacterium]